MRARTAFALVASVHACTCCLCIGGLHFLQAFLVVLPGKAHVPQELGVYPLRDLYLCDQSFLMPFLCHLRDWLCVVWHLDLAMSAR